MAKLKDVDVHAMDVLEEENLGHGTYVLRVEGGWIYWRIHGNNTSGGNNESIAGVFVPYKRG